MKRAAAWCACMALTALFGCTELNPTFRMEGGTLADAGPGWESGGDWAVLDKGDLTKDKGDPSKDKKVPAKDKSLSPDKGTPPPPTTSSLVSIPQALNFGAMGVGCEASRVRIFQLANPTSKNLSISKAVLVGCSKEFKLKPFQLGSVASGASRDSSVTLKPVSVGTKSCYLRVTTSDGLLIVPISAQVSPKTSQTDSFKQALNRAVDFIFVLDPSGSMSDEKPRLKATASTFATAAGSNKLDFHLGFISMVPGTGSGALPLGALQGSPPYLTGISANLKSEFEKRIDMPQGGGNETGFDALISALTPPLTAVINSKSCSGCSFPHVCHKKRCIGQNQGFRRASGASLEVLVFTDEDDGSKATLTAIRSFLSWQVDPIKGQFVRVHALLPSAKCAYGGVTFTRWKGLINSTGGEISDLCDKDYKPAIKALTERIFGLQDQFMLTRKPVVSSIKVWVNGKAVTGYKYNAASNSITATKAPADKSTIKISYTVSCK